MVKWQILGLNGRYCSSCMCSLRNLRLEKYDILPMCREDLDQFLRNGDMDLVKKIMEAKHESERP